MAAEKAIISMKRKPVLAQAIEQKQEEFSSVPPCWIVKAGSAWSAAEKGSSLSALHEKELGGAEQHVLQFTARHN